MSRQILDEGLLIWEVFPSGGEQGFSDDPYLVFHCLTRTDLRPRRLALQGDEATAERRVGGATEGELLALLAQSSELP